MLVLDWFEEHYPGQCALQDPAYGISPMWCGSKMLVKTTIIANESSYLGRVEDDKFQPWIGTMLDAQALYAADPEFFDKIDFWYKTRILDRSWENEVRDI